MELKTSVEKPDTTTVTNACRVADKWVFHNLKLPLTQPTARCRTNAMLGRSLFIQLVSSYCVKIIDFCNKAVQTAKEMAGGGLTKNWHGYKNNQLSWLINPNQWLMAVADGFTQQLSTEHVNKRCANLDPDYARNLNDCSFHHINNNYSCIYILIHHKVSNS